MWQTLHALDESAFLYLNSKHSPFFDWVMYWASNQYIWIPFYVGLCVFLYWRFHQAAYFYIVCAALMEVASDQLSSHLIKNLVRRPRPSHEAALAPYIHLSAAGPGGLYGFVSSHAANTFALALFLTLTLPRSMRPFKWVMVGWAGLVSYSRIYNGVHYPGDVLCGALLGAGLAVLFASIFRLFWGAYLLFVQKYRERHGTEA